MKHDMRALVLVMLALGWLSGCGNDDPAPGNGTRVITAANLGTFSMQNTAFSGVSTGATTFVTGPATPPLGSGSLQFSVGANGDTFMTLRTTDLAGVSLSAITALQYSTFVQTPGAGGGQAPYLLLDIDTDGDLTTTEDQLFFEPVYQDGTYGGDPIPAQGPLATGSWQLWDAHSGGWWSLNAGTFGPPLVTLANYITANPAARIATPSAGGGVRIAAGGGAGAWDGFVGNADKLVITVNGVTTTYDFEP